MHCPFTLRTTDIGTKKGIDSRPKPWQRYSDHESENVLLAGPVGRQSSDIRSRYRNASVRKARKLSRSTNVAFGFVSHICGHSFCVSSGKHFSRHVASRRAEKSRSNRLWPARPPPPAALIAFDKVDVSGYGASSQRERGCDRRTAGFCALGRS